MNNKIKYVLISSILLSIVGCSILEKKEFVITDEVYPIVDIDGGNQVDKSKQEIFNDINHDMLETKEGIKATTNNLVYFPFDSYELSEEAKNTIDIQIEALSITEFSKTILAGHTDERGDNNYNIILGEKRAKAVKVYLVNNGIDGKNVDIISFGEEKPVASGTGELSWGKNRRVSFEYK
jgi:peptidoglycan-associated lipoprotein